MKKKILILILFIILAVNLSACSSGRTLSASGWPGISGSDDSVYVAYGNRVYSLRLKDGSLNWRYPEKIEAARTYYANPAIKGSMIVVGDYRNSLKAFDSRTGSVIWSFDKAKNRYIGGAVIVGDTILAPNADYKLYALDLDGNLKWTFTARQALWSTPVVNGDVVYLTSMDHYIYAINIKDGNLIWELDMGGAIVYSPTFDEGTIYLASLGNEVVSIDAATGRINWKNPSDNTLWTQPVTANGLVFYGDSSGKFFAVEMKTGSHIWDYQMGEMVSGTPAIMPDGVVLAGENGKLIALDFEGNILWTRSTTGKLYTGPVVVDGFLILGISQGEDVIKTYDFNGNEIWKFIPEK